MAVDEETQGPLNQPYSGYFRTFLSRQPDMELVGSDPGTKPVNTSGVFGSQYVLNPT